LRGANSRKNSTEYRYRYGEGVERYEPATTGSEAEPQPQTKFRAFWLKFDRFREFWNPFCGRIRMKYRIKTIIVTCKISFILYDFIGFRSYIGQLRSLIRNVVCAKKQLFYKRQIFSLDFFCTGGSGPLGHGP